MVDATTTASIDGTTRVELVVPADPQLLRIVRLVASGLASLASLDLDGVEEVRVAADELVSTLIEMSAGEPVRIRLTITDDVLRLEASTALAPGATLEVDPMVDRVLEAVSTSHAWRTEDGVAHGTVERER
jgi:serine/threonine-protein kinase RsbW